MATYDKEAVIRYVDDELSPEEREKMEQELRTDPSLAEAVGLYRQIKETLKERLPGDDGVTALRDTLGEMKAKYFGETVTEVSAVRSGRVVRMRLLTGMAAAAVLLAVVISVWTFRGDSYLDRLGKTDMVSTTERGGNADSLLEQASVYFNKEQYDKALPILDRAVKADSSSQLALFYRGVAALHVSEAETARADLLAGGRRDLEQVYNSGSVLQYEAAFYLALSYAAGKDNAAALAWLKKVPDGTPVSGKTKELMEKLK